MDLRNLSEIPGGEENIWAVKIPTAHLRARVFQMCVCRHIQGLTKGVQVCFFFLAFGLRGERKITPSFHLYVYLVTLGLFRLKYSDFFRRNVEAIGQNFVESNILSSYFLVIHAFTCN